MCEPSSVGSHLHVHAEVYQVDHVLRVSFGLDSTTHITEGHEWLTIPHNEAGDDGVKGTLAGCDYIWTCRIE
jgi:hypothetical protein